MSIRKILFGYEIRGGEICVNDREAAAVRRIFKLYRDGESYKSVADALNREGVPYGDESPQWNKCKVKRTLENPRYAGKDGYPCVIADGDFQSVQALIRTKNSDLCGENKGVFTGCHKLESTPPGAMRHPPRARGGLRGTADRENVTIPREMSGFPPPPHGGGGVA